MLCKDADNRVEGAVKGRQPCQSVGWRWCDGSWMKNVQVVTNKGIWHGCVREKYDVRSFRENVCEISPNVEGFHRKNKWDKRLAIGVDGIFDVVLNSKLSGMQMTPWMTVVLKSGDLHRWQREFGYAGIIFHGTIVRLNRGLHQCNMQSLMYPIWSYVKNSNEQLHHMAGAGNTGHAGIGILWYVCERMLISIPQLCTYISAILCELSGIFNQIFQLDFLYFCFCLIDRIRKHSLCHESAMSPPHAHYICWTCDTGTTLLLRLTALPHARANPI